MFKKSGNEYGRTVMEMLMVAAIVALLGLLAITAFVHLRNKQTAQLVSKEVLMAHTRLVLMSDKSQKEWTQYPYPTGTSYALQYRFDALGKAFIRLEGVTKSICEQLLQETTLFTFLTDENTAFTECQDINAMLLSPTKSDVLAECKDHSECATGYCEGSRCIACPDGTHFSTLANECQEECTAHIDCGEGGYCDTTTDTCATCSGGRVYDETADKCVCSGAWCPGECMEDTDCGSGNETDSPHCSFGHCCRYTFEVYDDDPDACICPEDYFRIANGNCTACSDTSPEETTKAECDICSNRMMIGDVCAPLCTAGTSFRTSDGSCALCSSPDSVTPYSVAECESCSERAMVGDLCIKTVCEANYLKNSQGTCMPCSGYTPIIPLDSSACSTTCSGRVMIGDYCVPGCTSSQFHANNGECKNCKHYDQTVPLTEAECTQCPLTNSEYQRRLYKGVCYGSGCDVRFFRSSTGSCTGCGLIESTAPASWDQCLFCEAFADSTGICRLCSTNDAISATSQNCEVCGATSSPREMWNDKCVLVCNEEDGKKPCSNATNHWCCPLDAGCGDGKDENSKCTGVSKAKKCVYTLSSDSYDITVTYGEPYECDSDEYCYGKWRNDEGYQGEIVTGYMRTLYGMCLKKNESLDTEEEDLRNPWLVESS